MLIAFLMMVAGGDIDAAQRDSWAADHEWKSCVKRYATSHALDTGSAASIAESAVANCKSSGDSYQSKLMVFLLLADKNYHGVAKNAEKDVGMTRRGGTSFRREEAAKTIADERAKPRDTATKQQLKRARDIWESCYRVYAATHVGDDGGADIIADGAVADCKAKGDIYEAKLLSWVRVRDQSQYPMQNTTAEKTARDGRNAVRSQYRRDALTLVNKYRVE